MGSKAPIAAFALHIWGNHDQTAPLDLSNPARALDEYNAHPTTVLVRYMTHRTSLLAKVDMLAELDC